jgi:alpha-D-ribose 1-methylphosphonate 5-triphosphate synthase subunit PhnL
MNATLCKNSLYISNRFIGSSDEMKSQIMTYLYAFYCADKIQLLVLNQAEYISTTRL